MIHAGLPGETGPNRATPRAPTEHALRFECAGESLIGVLSRPAAPMGGPDPRPGPARLGVVIAVGGPQYRAGSHRQFVLLARRLAAAGHPVLRFDCRGMGDSSGDFPGFEHLDADLAAAAAALRAAVPGLAGVALWGLCDAASAALIGAAGPARWQALVLLNPWARHVDTQLRTEVKSYYAKRLFEPAFWRKLRSGGVRVGPALAEFAGKLLRMAASYARPSTSPGADAPPADFRERMARGALAFEGPQLYILSGRDHVCAEFLEFAASHPRLPALWQRPRVERLALPAADHTFSSQALRRAVEDATVAFLARVARGDDGVDGGVRHPGGADRVPEAVAIPTRR